MRSKHSLKPTPKHILPTAIIDHNMYKGGADQKRANMQIYRAYGSNI
jgi:hypothetical protein